MQVLYIYFNTYRCALQIKLLSNKISIIFQRDIGIPMENWKNIGKWLEIYWKIVGKWLESLYFCAC